MSISIRRRMFLLAAAGALPLALMAGVALFALGRAQTAQLERSSMDVTRALTAAVDAELQRTIAALSAAAESEVLWRGDVEGFRGYAARLARGQPHWQRVQLIAPGGRILADTLAGADPPPVADPASLARALATRAPAVGRLSKWPGDIHGVPVRVPVVIDGELRFVLTAVVDPEPFRQILESQNVPPASVISVFDASGARVARSRLHKEFLGTQPAPTLRELMAAQGAEGIGLTRALEGDPVFTSYSTSTRGTGWTVALGIPEAVSYAVPWRSAAMFGGGLLLSILFGAAAAFLLARRMSRPIEALRADAQALGRGEAFTPPVSDIREIDEVARALADAAARRAEGEAQREALLAAERAAREEAECARQRLALLAGAGEELSRSLAAADTLAAVARTVVPGIADWCRIDLLDPAGNLQRALTHHADPARARRGAELVGKLQAAPDAVGSMAWTVRTGQSHLVNFDAPASFDPARDRDLLTFAGAIGMRAYYIVPLVARGRTLGAMAALQAESGRSFAAADCALLDELARRVALALDNARLYGELTEALAHAETANRAKDEFLAMLGHELRNPLAPIVTALRLMELRRDQDTAHERRIIERQVAHMRRLVDDLLDVSRITQGKVQLKHEMLDLREVVARTIELTEPVFSRRAHGLEVSVPDEPLPVRGDAVRLAQVFCNLLTNAAKFTPAEGHVRLSVARRGEEVEVGVRDTGSGIDAALLPRVFDLFVQGAQTIDRSAGGLGLGLAIARTLVDMHGGQIAAASEGPGRGASFTVTLPVAQGALPGAARPRAALAPGIGRVLVVDDNADAAATLAELLAIAGYEVRTATDGDAALAALADFEADIALLDIGLPGMSGHELAARLRADVRHGALRLVALTGYGGETARERALAGAFDLHLTKPVGAEELLEAVEGQLRESGARRAGYGFPDPGGLPDPEAVAGERTARA